MSPFGTAELGCATTKTDTAGWTYRAPVRYGRNLECLFLCWHALLRRDHPGYCTAEVGNPGGTYELPCIVQI